MKTLIGKGVSTMVLSAFVFAPIASHAQLDANLTGDSKMELDSAVEADVDANTSVDTSTETDSKINSDASTDTNVELDLGGDVEEDDSNDVETKTESDTDTSLKVNSSGVAVISSAQVNSESDLEVFSANVKAKDKKVAKVDIESEDDGESEIKVIYRHNGKFLGFIPVTVKSTTIVEAEAEAEVKSRLSWWSFLVADENYSKAELESRVKNNPMVRANARANASAQAKAQIAEAVLAEVATHANTQASLNR